MESLVSTAWLAEALAGGAPPVVLDASHHLADPASGVRRDAEAEYRAGHIPGALFMDIAIPAAQFAPAIARLGLTPASRVVVYDDSALHSAARGWFLLRLYGFEDVAILDGGLAQWRAEGRPLEAGEPTPEPSDFAAAPDRQRLANKAELSAALGDASRPLADARSAAPEPHPGLAPGHIPGARNLPYASLYRPDGALHDTATLAAAFAAAGLDATRPFTASCGSGVTACALLFAAHRLGNDRAALYEGSWAEWGADPATPKATGPA